MGGTVWLRTGAQEQVLTTSAVEFPLGLDGDRAIVARDATPLTPIVAYRGRRVERITQLAGMCLSSVSREIARNSRLRLLEEID